MKKMKINNITAKKSTNSSSIVDILFNDSTIAFIKVKRDNFYIESVSSRLLDLDKSDRDDFFEVYNMIQRELVKEKKNRDDNE